MLPLVFILLSILFVMFCLKFLGGKNKNFLHDEKNKTKKISPQLCDKNKWSATLCELHYVI